VGREVLKNPGAHRGQKTGAFQFLKKETWIESGLPKGKSLEIDIVEEIGFNCEYYEGGGWGGAKKSLFWKNPGPRLFSRNGTIPQGRKN